MTRTHGFYSIYTNIQWNNCHFPTKLVQTKLHVGTLCLDDHHQSFGSWSIARFNVFWLSWAQQSISTRFSWSMSENLRRYTIGCNGPNCIINRIKIRAVWRPVFRFKELRHIWAQVSNSVAWTMWRRSVLLKQIREHCSRWCIVAKFQTLTIWNNWTNSVGKWQLFHCMLM